MEYIEYLTETLSFIFFRIKITLSIMTTIIIVITITAIIIKILIVETTITIIMKTIAIIKVALIIKLIAPRRHQSQKKLYSYLKTVW